MPGEEAAAIAFRPALRRIRYAVANPTKPLRIRRCDLTHGHRQYCSDMATDCYDRQGPGAAPPRGLFFLSRDFVPLFPEVLFDFIHFLPGVVLHPKKHCARSGIIGIRKIESRQKRAPA